LRPPFEGLTIHEKLDLTLTKIISVEARLSELELEVEGGARKKQTRFDAVMQQVFGNETPDPFDLSAPLILKKKK
jgi:hypothetical protein